MLISGLTYLGQLCLTTFQLSYFTKFNRVSSYEITTLIFHPLFEFLNKAEIQKAFEFQLLSDPRKVPIIPAENAAEVQTTTYDPLIPVLSGRGSVFSNFPRSSKLVICYRFGTIKRFFYNRGKFLRVPTIFRRNNTVFVQFDLFLMQKRVNKDLFSFSLYKIDALSLNLLNINDMF